MLIAAVVARELPVVVRVVDQAVARPGVAAHGSVGDEDLVRGAVDVVGVGAHGERRRHRPAARGAAHDVEGEARLQQRLVEPGMRRAVGAAAAGDQPQRRAVDEAIEPGEVAGRIERHVVVHDDAAGTEPARGAGDRRAGRMQEHEPLRLGRQQLGREPLQLVRLLAGAGEAHGQHEVGLPDRLLRPGRELVVGDEQHVVVAALQRIERPRRLRAVEAGAAAAAPRARFPTGAPGCCWRDRTRPPAAPRTAAAADSRRRG